MVYFLPRVFHRRWYRINQWWWWGQRQHHQIQLNYESPLGFCPEYLADSRQKHVNIEWSEIWKCSTYQQYPKWMFVWGIHTCNHARTVLCITSWMVNKRPRTASCSSIISLVVFFIPSNKFLAPLPFRCWRSSNTISSLAWSDHFTLITCNETQKLKGASLCSGLD